MYVCICHMPNKLVKLAAWADRYMQQKEASLTIKSKVQRVDKTMPVCRKGVTFVCFLLLCFLANKETSPSIKKISSHSGDKFNSGLHATACKGTVLSTISTTSFNLHVCIYWEGAKKLCNTTCVSDHKFKGVMQGFLVLRSTCSKTVNRHLYLLSFWLYQMQECNRNPCNIWQDRQLVYY